MSRPVPTACLLAMTLSLTACPQGSVGTPGPGESGYVPPDWVAPTLSYDRAEYLPSRVVAYKQAPGYYARNDSYRLYEGNEDKILDFPDGGGTYAPNNDSIVSLGMAGGYVVLEFDPPLENYEDQADFMVFGNAYFMYGNAERVWQEPGTVWVHEDDASIASGGTPPEDGWLLLAPAYKYDGETWTELGSSSATLSTITYDYATFESEGNESWWPVDADGTTSLSFENVFILPDVVYTGTGTTTPMTRGLADAAPSMVLGDLSGSGSLNLSGEADNSVEGEDDYPDLDPVYLYTIPDTPGDRDIDAGSGGGNAMDLDWAVDPQDSFSAKSVTSVRWVKIVSGTTLESATGDYSCEVDAVVRALEQ